MRHAGRGFRTPSILRKQDRTHAARALRGVAGTSIGVAVLLWDAPLCAAAPKFTGELVGASAGTLSQGSSLDATQALRTELALRTSWSEQRPRSTWSLSLAGKTDFEPVSSAEKAQTSSPTLQPVLGAGLSWNASERLTWTMAGHASASLGGLRTSELGTDPASLPQPVSELGVEVGSSPPDSGLAQTEAASTLPLGLGQAGGDVAIRYQWSGATLVAGIQADRAVPLSCASADPELEALGLSSGSLGSRQLGLRAGLDRSIDEARTLRASASIRDDLSLRGACGLPALWEGRPESLSRLISVQAGLTRRLESGAVSLQAGLTAVATRAEASTAESAPSDAAAGSETVADVSAETPLWVSLLLADQPWTLRPALDAQVESRGILGSWKLKAQAEVSRLPGRALPTWNVGGDVQGLLPLGTTAALAGTLSLQQSLTVGADALEADSALEASSPPLQVRTAQVGLSWAPRWWIRGALGWSLTARETFPLDPAQQLFLVGQALYLSCSLALEPGQRTW